MLCATARVPLRTGSIWRVRCPVYNGPEPTEDLIVSFHFATRAGMRLTRNFSLVLLAGALAIAGCGSNSSSSSTSASSSTPAVAPATTPSTSKTTKAPSAPTTISLAANPEGVLKFDKSTLAATAGSVSISFTNNSPVPHNVTVASPSGSVIGATATFQGGTKILPLNLKPGTYVFYCSVPGHRAAGMEGKLTVH
jgi:plastocyanin